jgi:metal-sulfur cluster biosynthetic enzyme
MSELLAKEEQIVKMIKTVYDPEIPVNIYDLGLIYSIEVNDTTADITMTLTAPNCPAADFIVEDTRYKIESVEGIETSYLMLIWVRW